MDLHLNVAKNQCRLQKDMKVRITFVTTVKSGPHQIPGAPPDTGTWVFDADSASVEKVALAPDEAEPAYEERYVAYLDILGYSNLIADNTDPDKARAVIGDLRQAIGKMLFDREYRCGQGYWQGTTLRVMSDAVLLTAPASDNGCFDMVMLAANVIALLAYRDIWVRGALTLGPHYDDGDVLFSPAMTAAYKTERDEAFYPRVLVDRSVANACQTLGPTSGPDLSFWEARRATLRRIIWPDHDGRQFISYLSLIDVASLADDSHESKFLRAHRDHITRRLTEYEDDPRKCAKYGWLADYHNRFCQQFLDPKAAARYAIRIPGIP